MDGSLLALSLVSAFAFALALVLTQFGLRGVGPATGASISIPTTAGLFLVLAPVLVDPAGWNRHSALLFAFAGLVFPVSVTLLTFAANRLIGPDLTGSLGNLTPLFAVAFAIILVGEAPSAGQFAGIATICLGIALLFRGRGRDGSTVPRWAYLLPLAAALVRGLVQPVVKFGLIAWPDPIAAATIGYLVSALVVLSIAAMRRREPPAAGNSAGRRGRFWFAAVGICNGAAVLALYAALARGPVTLVAPIVACYPLATLALNRILRGDRSLAPSAALGVGLSVAGVALLLVA
ncbi:DMT family transporter [Oceanibacterium hippocampi]|uniref:EamA-like transporter family protein n=1 Tax=Oceanibacterium hippocampi TaxID=745714 RepID=A0A1Y5TUE1_9PROT|nr:DMT family transporter [Oceanibacterium hippocampi]SLN72985.1 EamA-like transporter family protein [Oceanibacterium hippocampi]